LSLLPPDHLEGDNQQRHAEDLFQNLVGEANRKLCTQQPADKKADRQKSGNLDIDIAMIVIVQAARIRSGAPASPMCSLRLMLDILNKTPTPGR